MIPLRRPQVENALDATARSYLTRRSEAARTFPPGDARIGTAWASFLATKTRAQVAEALDAYTRAKCAYCEQVAAKDIEHFRPKTSYPDWMFSWDNFLRGCKNCNNAKSDRFPLDDTGERLLLDPSQDEPLDHLVWDSTTGAAGVTPDPTRAARGHETVTMFQLNQEPYREERRIKHLRMMYLLARVVEENPIEARTIELLREELRPHRPWLGVIRQLLIRPVESERRLLDQALIKLPEIRDWASEWL